MKRAFSYLSKMSESFDENKLVAKQSDFKSCFARSMAINNSKCVRKNPPPKPETIQENLDLKISFPVTNEVRLKKVSKKHSAIFSMFISC